MAISLGPDARRRWAWRLAVAFVVGYAAWLRLVILVERYGPFDHPGWLVTLSRVVEAPKPLLAPASWQWAKVDPAVRRRRSDQLPEVRAGAAELLRLDRTRAAVSRGHTVLLQAHRQSGHRGQLCVADVLGPLRAGTYLLGSAAVSRPVGLAAAGALAIEQEFAAWAPEGWRDETFTAFVLLTAWALLRLKAHRTWQNTLLLGVVGGAACLTRITSMSFVVPGLVWVAWPRDRGVMAGVSHPRCRRGTGHRAAGRAVPDQLLPHDWRSAHRDQLPHAVLPGR